MPSIFDLIPLTRRKPVRIAVPRANSINRDDVEYVDLIELDAAVRETHSSAAEPTDSAIEDGSVITDHIDIAPKSLIIEGIVSNTPLTIQSVLIGNAAGLVGSIIGRSSNSNITGALAAGGLSTFGNSIARIAVDAKNRAKTAFEAMQTAQESGATLTIITRYKVYNDMIIRDLQATRDASTGNILTFTATFREIRIVNSRSGRTDPRSIERLTQASAASETNEGRQQANEATDQTQQSFTDRLSNESIFSILRNQ